VRIFPQCSCHVQVTRAWHNPDMERDSTQSNGPDLIAEETRFNLRLYRERTIASHAIAAR
jgi:hypothetical protein